MSVFGHDLHKVVKQVAVLRRREIKAKQYGLDMGKESDRLIAAEEVLSELAQTNPKSGLVQRAIAAIKKWIREYVPGFENMQLSDSEIIERYLVPARDFVQQGGTAAPGAFAGAFARKEFNNKQKLTELDANRELAELTRNMRQASTEAQAREAAKEFVAKKPLPPINIENLETCFLANVSWHSFGKMAHHSATNHSVSREAHFLAMANIDKLFRLATRELPPRKGFKEGDGAYIEAIRHFDVPMMYKGEILLVEMMVEQYKTPDKTGHRIYTLQSVEIGTPASYKGPRRLGFPSSSVHPPAGVERRFTQMAAIVKGELRPEDTIGTPPKTRFSRSSPAVASPAASSRLPSIAPFRARMDKVIDSLIYNFQDRFKPLKDIQKRVGLVPEEEDAALAEERYSGKVRARVDDFEAELREPLIKAIHESRVEYDVSRNTS